MNGRRTSTASRLHERNRKKTTNRHRAVALLTTNISNSKKERNKTMDKKFNKNKIYGHTELALLYFTNILPKSASTQLTRWIQRDEELWEALKKAGYRKGQRIYTPLQRDILFEHLGAPDCWTVE